MEIKFTVKQVRDSKKEALEKIKSFLDSEDVDGQFSDRTGSYHSSDKFIVAWNANYNGMPSEFGIDKTDAFYADYSGYKAIYVTRGLFHEKQLAGYSSIERALIEVGLKLCGKKEKRHFFEKYATKYNARFGSQNKNEQQ